MESQRRNAVLVSVLLIAVFFAALALEIPKGILSNTDELLTAERSREMLLLGRSEVHFNFEPSFAKPPLQYWLTSLTLPVFKNRTLAVRIWPLIYGLLTTICVGWWAFVLEPERPWLMPLAIAITLSCPLFSTEASRALLDIGLAFFVTLTFVFAQLARARPTWWVGVAIVCWLGSLQKIPLVVLIWALILIWRLAAPEDRRSLRNRWLLPSIIGAVVVSSIWLAIQLRYGMSPRSVYHQEVVAWLGPANLGSRSFLEIPYRLIITSACGVFLLAAPVAILLWRRQNFSRPIREISIAVLGLIVLEVVTNFRLVRYVVPVIPALCLMLAIVLHRLLEREFWARFVAATLLVVLLVAGLVQVQLQLQLRRKNVATEKRVAEKLGTLQEKAVTTILLNARNEGTALLYDGFYLFHGNLRFPLTKYTSQQIQASPPSPPALGVCIAADFPIIQKVYANPRIEFALAQFVIWRAD